MYLRTVVKTGFIIEDISWLPGENEAHIEVIGPGATGGGSNSTTPGGAGGSGAWAESWCTRPASGISKVNIDAGAPSVAANSPVDGNNGGIAEFRRDYTDSTAWVACRGAGGGQASVGGLGGDGGTPGIAYGSHVTDWIQGGQGQASCANTGSQFPLGASAPRGGFGGNNNQGGSAPGGGGSPGTNMLASGVGGAGKIKIDFFS